MATAVATARSPEAMAIISPGRPFRATALWQQMVLAFNKHIPLKRHRYHLKSYDYCFTGREMIDWLFEYLIRNPNFGKDITRQQAVLVASKLLNQGIVVTVRLGSNLHGDEQSVHDDNHLYRLDRAQHDSLHAATSRKKKMSRDIEVEPVQPYNSIPPLPHYPNNEENNSTIPHNYPLQDVSNQKPESSSTNLKNASDYHSKSHRIRATSSCTQSNHPKRSHISSVIIKRFHKTEKSNPSQVVEVKSDKIEQSAAQAPLPEGPLPVSSHPLPSSSSSSSAALSQPRKYNYEDLEHVHLPKATLQQIWRNAITNRLSNILNLRSIDDLIRDPEAIDGQLITKNVKQTIKPRPIQQSDYYIGEIKNDDIPYWVRSAMNCLANWPNGKVMGEKRELPIHSGYHVELLSTIGSYFANLDGPLLTHSLFELYATILDLLSASQPTAKEALQLALLLLPTKNRQHLKILLQFMSKTDKNESLSIGNEINSKREMILLTFSKNIFSSVTPTRHELHVSARLVTYLLDHYTSLFEIPARLKIIVGKQIKAAKIKEREKPKEVVYCDRISPDQYKTHGSAATRQSLKSLLMHIYNNNNMDTRTKKSRLKQFQKMYPEIYIESFPDSNLQYPKELSLHRKRKNSLFQL
ncbi:DEP domain-containing protein 1B [Trichoplax sp. H2]|nr:DEP domain-containing protein 1B [Trichoplax sp. H2]|eukprot:RDD38012.1 DEP domain-containing protein 1B [Trichoplax sp. H2]